jgi:NADH dehydrogenase
MNIMSHPASSSSTLPHVVIVGGGFGGLYTAQSLGDQPVKVTLIDKRNFHLFQPLLYQVATGSLSPSDIAAPLRSVLAKFENTSVLLDEVIGIDVDNQLLTLKEEPEPLHYDRLVLATGSQTHFFGHDDWAKNSLELKTLESALDMRRRVLSAFENAERETDPVKQASAMNFVIVGGGPTGVELAGAVAELARFTLKRDFRRIDCTQARITLVEAGPRILSVYPEELSRWTVKKLGELGVTVREATAVTDIQPGCITLSQNGQVETIQADTVLWGAGVKASGLGQMLAEKTGVELDRGGRVMVETDLSIKGYPHIFVIGDLACYTHTADKRPLPGVAPVAMQEGSYVARRILADIFGYARPAFQYVDKGNLAVVSFNEAVASIGKVRLTGFLAWLIWAFVHIFYLIEFDSKVIVLFQWIWSHFTQRRSARLITGSYE